MESAKAAKPPHWGLGGQMPCSCEGKINKKKLKNDKNKNYALGLFDPSPTYMRNLMNCLGAEVVIFYFPQGHENPFIIAQQPEKCVQNRVINPNQTVVSLNGINTRMQEELTGSCFKQISKSFRKTFFINMALCQ